MNTSSSPGVSRPASTSRAPSSTVSAVPAALTTAIALTMAPALRVLRMPLS